VKRQRLGQDGRIDGAAEGRSRSAVRPAPPGSRWEARGSHRDLGCHWRVVPDILEPAI
jgi:hypothetical protein